MKMVVASSEKVVFTQKWQNIFRSTSQTIDEMKQKGDKPENKPEDKRQEVTENLARIRHNKFALQCFLLPS